MIRRLQTRILREIWEVEAALSGFDLFRDKLLHIRTLALGAGADATPFHAANAAGTYAYHQGVFGPS